MVRRCIAIILTTINICASADSVIVTGADGYMNVRSGPGKQYKIVDKIYKNSSSKYLSTASNNNWHQIRTPNGVTGYVNYAGVEIVSSSHERDWNRPVPPPQNIRPRYPAPRLDYTKSQILTFAGNNDANRVFREYGLNFYHTVTGAVNYDASALRQLMAGAPIENSAFAARSQSLWRLMHWWGDETFSQEVGALMQRYHEGVYDMLKGQVRNPELYLETYFPQTWIYLRRWS